MTVHSFTLNMLKYMYDHFYCNMTLSKRLAKCLPTKHVRSGGSVVDN